MATSENIEAKLAAYVDGELDAATRAEIEQHLVANPQHRKLIEELMRTRQYLRELPRNAAPGDVSEFLGAQLERAALLGDVNIGADTRTMRLGRWPQIRAIAAVIVLTGALAAILYLALPSPKERAPQVAVIPPEQPVTEVATPRASDALKDEVAIADDRPGAAMRGALGETDAAKKTSPAEELSLDKSVAAAPASPTTSAFAAATPAPAMLNGGDNANAVVNARYLVVRAPDPVIACSRVTQYLNDNQIPFQQMPPQQPGLFAVASTPSTQPIDRDGVVAGSGLAISTASNVAAAGSGMAIPRASNSPASSAPSTQPDLSISAPAVAEANAHRSDSLEAIARGQLQQPANGEQVIIARNLTPRQAMDLMNALAEEKKDQVGQSMIALVPAAHPSQIGNQQQAFQGNQQAVQSNLQQAMEQSARREAAKESKAIEPGAAPPATQPTTAPISDALAAGDTVRVQGRDELNHAGPFDDTQTIDADGKIIVPMLGKVQAAGMTAVELADSLEQSVNDGKLQHRMVWSIEKTESAPTGPSTQPTEWGAASPTTSPAASEAPVDVIILIQQESAPASQPISPMIAPSTQPSTPPTTVPSSR